MLNKKTIVIPINLLDNSEPMYLAEDYFYTSDVGSAQLAFQFEGLPDYSGDITGELILNSEDKSLFRRELSMVKGTMVYQVEPEILAHYGNTIGQLALKQNERTLATREFFVVIKQDQLGQALPQAIIDLGFDLSFDYKDIELSNEDLVRITALENYKANLDYVDIELNKMVNREEFEGLLEGGNLGQIGMSAYQVAVHNGYVGTEDDWLITLNGSQGVKGEPGTVGTTGPRGIQGDTGIQGPKGETGSQGPQGEIGLTGSGLDGVDGAQGIAGLVGADGLDGDDGLDVYQTWLLAGNTGTEVEFLLTLNGTDGAQGATGPTGAKGEKGDLGSSAYQVALANGFVGSEAVWLGSLIGATGSQGVQGTTGDTGPQGVQGVKGDTGSTGPQGEIGLQGIKGDTGDTGLQGNAGANGASAYTQAIAGGFVGSESAWIDSLKGDTGEQGVSGLSAYEIAVNKGYTGTEEAWVTSLKGETGAQGIQGSPGTTIQNIKNGVGLALWSGSQTELDAVTRDTNVLYFVEGV